MLVYNFKNYDEFKENFGIIEHGNGTKSRKNKILLALYKDKDAFKRYKQYKEYASLLMQRERLETRCVQLSGLRYRHCRDFLNLLNRRINEMPDKIGHFGLLDCTSLSVLKIILQNELCVSYLYKGGCNWALDLNGRTYFSDEYRTDDFGGLCEDGTLNAIRYVKIESGRVFKMKAGKMFNHILSRNIITDTLPEQVKVWMGEQFVADWTEYARENLGGTKFTLRVDDDFRSIYNSCKCKGNFHSCMTDNGQWAFFRDAIAAKAAALLNDEGDIVARCIVYTNVHEFGSDKIWRLAERQYSTDSDLSLQRQLVMALIRDGHIDGYKRVGASCHAAKEFVDNEGNSLESKNFYIDCTLDDGDTLSYQDSFKWYDEELRRADNCGYGDKDLAVTDSTYYSDGNHEHDCWSEYNQEWIYEDDAYYVEERDDYFHYDQVAYALIRRQSGSYYEDWCFEDDCLEIEGQYFYAGYNTEDPEYYGIVKCPQCGEYMVPGRTSTYYSELTEEDYCCDSCRDVAEDDFRTDNGWAYSKHDGEWFEDADDVITVAEFDPYRCLFRDTTISVESFNNLVERRMATEFNGVFYIDDVNYEGEPVHAAA